MSFAWKQDAGLNGQLWVWVHPDTFQLILELIRKACRKVNASIEVGLLNDLIRFELTGPRSQFILSHCLELADEPLNNAHKVNLFLTLSFGNHYRWCQVQNHFLQGPLLV